MLSTQKSFVSISHIKQAQDNQAKYASEVATKYVLTGNKLVDDLIEKANSGNLQSFDKDIFNGLIDKGALSKIGNADINTLQRLLDEGKLDANTSTIVTNLIKAKETAENVGTTLESIADECNKVGITKEWACFNQFNKGAFIYIVETPDNLIHCFDFTGTDFQLFDKIKVEDLLIMSSFITFKYKVWLDGKVIGESAMSFNPNKIHI